MFNIIRTSALELSTIPAIVYKQKLASGGAGLRIFRLDQDAIAVFTIESNTGEGTPYGPYDKNLFPEEAIHEALELTVGLPYSARGKINISITQNKLEKEDVAEDSAPNQVDMVNSIEYQSIVDRYCDEKGKINYHLMNKDFIQFAAKSKVVASLVEEKAKPEEILMVIVQNRAAFIANQKESISLDDTRLLIETLDEIDPRSAFKDLNIYIRRLLANKK